MKSEPEVFSIQNLKRDKKTWWEGVRNYQARNYMLEMKIGDEILFYHSNAEPPGVAGLATVCQVAAPDQTQFNKKSEYFDEKASPEKPRWFCVEVSFVAEFKNFITLTELRAEKKLSELVVLQKGSRLSVQPVDKKHFDLVKKMGG